MGAAHVITLHAMALKLIMIRKVLEEKLMAIWIRDIQIFAREQVSTLH
jgi:hypothetical protein